MCENEFDVLLRRLLQGGTTSMRFDNEVPGAVEEIFHKVRKNVDRVFTPGERRDNFVFDIR